MLHRRSFGTYVLEAERAKVLSLMSQTVGKQNTARLVLTTWFQVHMLQPQLLSSTLFESVKYQSYRTEGYVALLVQDMRREKFQTQT